MPDADASAAPIAGESLPSTTLLPLPAWLMDALRFDRSRSLFAFRISAVRAVGRVAAPCNAVTRNRERQ